MGTRRWSQLVRRRGHGQILYNTKNQCRRRFLAHLSSSTHRYRDFITQRCRGMVFPVGEESMAFVVNARIRWTIVPTYVVNFNCRRVTPLHSIAALSLACAGINTCKRAKKSSPPRLAQGVINTVGARSFYQTLCREFIFVSKPLTNH